MLTKEGLDEIEKIASYCLSTGSWNGNVLCRASDGKVFLEHKGAFYNENMKFFANAKHFVHKLVTAIRALDSSVDIDQRIKEAYKAGYNQGGMDTMLRIQIAEQKAKEAIQT